MRLRTTLIFLLGALLLPGLAGPQETRVAIERGLAYLASQQNDNGSFGQLPGAPVKGDAGITGLVLKAFYQAPEDLRAPHAEVLERALGYLVAEAREDGSIGNPNHGLSNYRTSVGIAALIMADREKYADMIAAGRDYIVSIQIGESWEVGSDNPTYGGFGYGTPSGRRRGADLSNTAYALEALVEAGLDPESEVFQKAKAFLSRTQDSEANDLEGVTVEGSGGFIYNPNVARDREAERDEDGNVVLKPYAGMTYSGLKSLIYAGLTEDDPRVQAALAWISANYTLEENAGLGARGDAEAGKAGLYYYYAVFARCLEVLGKDVIVTEDGTEHDWSAELAAKLCALQREDGSWQNSNRRWWENDPVLASAYALEGLGIALRQE